jgi:hypothetical protein
MKRVLLLGVLFSLGGCPANTTPNPAPKAMIGTLSVELRQTVDVSFTPRIGQDGLDAVLAFGDGDFDVFDAHTTLRGSVTVESFPEAQLSLYVATFSAPARAGGPCGDQPMTLALSLERRQSNARVGGGLTVYCGASKASGVPARILRMSGDLPLL